MSDKNMQVLLANRPKGWVQESDFKIVENDVPAAGEGEVARAAPRSAPARLASAADRHL